MFMFYQREFGVGKWQAALAESRDEIVASGPALVSVLNVSSSFKEEPDAKELAGLRYSAPTGFYVDFDAGDVQEALDDARKLLENLRDEHGLNLGCVLIYLTGGRGVHLEIPMQVFLKTVPSKGIVGLPLIFKEIAKEIEVDTLDMRVYSAGRGRMWRTPNVQRDNGLYKVQVSWHEFEHVTPETYKAICSKPRPALPVDAPEFTHGLALLYSQAVEGVDKVVKSRAKRKAGNPAGRFSGNYPLSYVEAVLQCKGLNKDLGFNLVALQVASFAVALNRTEEEFLAECAILIDEFVGDGVRYNTPAKRRQQLRSQFRYQSGGSSVEFSIGGIKSLYAPGVSSSDLDWGDIAGDFAGSTTHDFGDPVRDFGSLADRGLFMPRQQTYVASEEEIATARTRSLESAPIQFGPSGIFVKPGEDAEDSSPRRVSSAGLGNPTLLMDSHSGNDLGFEVDVFVDSEHRGRHMLPASCLTSKSTFQTWLSSWSCSISANDAAVVRMLDVMRVQSKNKEGAAMYLVVKEGVDIFERPNHPAEIIFTSTDGVLSLRETPLKFRGAVDSGGTFKSDLWDSPALADTPEVRTYIDHLLEINGDRALLGKVLGWFIAAFMTQPIRKIFRQFPLLQVYGQSGAGKSKTCELLSHLHYYKQEPKVLAAAGSTFYPLMVAVTQSASIPVFFDEYKPRHMSQSQRGTLRNLLHNNYPGSSIERGSVSTDSGERKSVINNYSNTAPILFLGEAMESETAIVERCVLACFTKEGRYGRSEHFDYVFENLGKGILGSIGKSCALSVVSSDIDVLADVVRKRRGQATSRYPVKYADDASRPIFNVAVALAGLDLFRETLGVIFGETYNDRINDMAEAVLASVGSDDDRIMSEASKVLDVLASMTREQDPTYRLEAGRDYYTDQIYVDIHIRNCFTKYLRYVRALGLSPLYEMEDAFAAGLRAYTACVNSERDMKSVLRATPFEKIYRLSCQAMADEGVDSFFVF